MTDLYEIEDPRPIAASAKYTFYLPPQDRLEAIGPGDLVKVMMRPIPASEDWDAERVWLKVLSAGSDRIEATLESEPLDMPLIPKGMVLRTPLTHVLDVIFENPDKEAMLAPDLRREYWEGCYVDRAILEGKVRVHFIYREEPFPAQEGERFPDSGWRIHGKMRNVSQDELDQREVDFVALGAVLNKDDSWLQFIDEPVGAVYERDVEDDVFVAVA